MSNIGKYITIDQLVSIIRLVWTNLITVCYSKNKQIYMPITLYWNNYCWLYNISIVKLYNDIIEYNIN